MKPKKTSTKRIPGRATPAGPSTFAPATALAPPDDGTRLTAALATIERLREEARLLSEAAVKHETTLERVYRFLSGGG